VELFEFRGEDITEEEDGGIIRRIVTKGRDTPNLMKELLLKVAHPDTLVSLQSISLLIEHSVFFKIILRQILGLCASQTAF